ncbi:MAG: Cupin domain [Actinomycetia bacterium]|nr:Cupin domain [Actinomycetes bacterium]
MHTVTVSDSQGPIDRITPRLLLGPGDEGCTHLAAVRINVPAGARMGEHAHGDSETLLTVLTGEIVLHSKDGPHPLRPGVIAHVAVGEQVGVANPGDQPATLLAIFTPPEFAVRLPR